MTTIVKALAGSRLYGTNHAGSDMDFMGIGVASMREKLGLRYVEQIGADDDVTYELTKWARLAVNGNPTVLQMLWVGPDNASQTLECHPQWSYWQMKLRSAVLSQRCIPAFLGYMDGQRKKILSSRGQRPELIAKHGYDTKFAAHMIRLALQGIEVKTTGSMSLPCVDVMLLREIIAGKYTQPEVLAMAEALENTLKIVPSILPETIDPDALDSLLASIYAEVWEY